MSWANKILADVEQFWPAELLRVSSISRWGMIVAMAKEQSVAAHQWEVAAIFMILSKNLKTVDDHFLSDRHYSSYFLPGIVMAMFHDMPEVFSGDISSPAKTMYDMELDSRVPAWVKRLELMAPITYGGDSPIGELAKSMVKLCDIISALAWANKFSLPGDTYSINAIKELQEELQERIEDTKHKMSISLIYPPANWFSILENFTKKGDTRSVARLMKEVYDE